jgi:hypothetical protein
MIGNSAVQPLEPFDIGKKYNRSREPIDLGRWSCQITEGLPTA